MERNGKQWERNGKQWERNGKPREATGSDETGGDNWRRGSLPQISIDSRERGAWEAAGTQREAAGSHEKQREATKTREWFCDRKGRPRASAGTA